MYFKTWAIHSGLPSHYDHLRYVVFHLISNFNYYIPTMLLDGTTSLEISYLSSQLEVHVREFIQDKRVYKGVPNLLTKILSTGFWTMDLLTAGRYRNPLHHLLVKWCNLLICSVCVRALNQIRRSAVQISALKLKRINEMKQLQLRVP